MGDFEAATDAADRHVPRDERDVFEVETAVNHEPAALFAQHAEAPSTIAEAVIGHAGAQVAAAEGDESVPDDRPTRRQPALELLALHAASSLAGNASAAIVAPPSVAATAALAADEDLAIPVEGAPAAIDERAADEGAADEGATDEGATDEGAADEGAADEGAANEAAPDEGAADEAAPDEGAADEAAADEAAADEVAAREGAGERESTLAVEPSERPVAYSTVINAVPKEIDDAHTEQLSGASATPTTQTPALETDAEHADRIAQQRGLRPITRPGMREARVRRRWVIASTAISLVCLAVTATVVVWARGEVGRARTARAAEPRELVASNTGTGTRVARPAQPAVVMPGIAPATPTCAIRVTSNIEAATVWIDGLPHGTVPAEVPVECGIDSLVELRHPRYASFKRSLSVAAGVLEVEARLEREQTELTVWSDPPGATVTYNGHALGKTPLVTHVNRYEHGTLWFRAPGRAADWRKIIPKQAKKTVSVTLEPRT